MLATYIQCCSLLGPGVFLSYSFFLSWLCFVLISSSSFSSCFLVWCDSSDDGVRDCWLHGCRKNFPSWFGKYIDLYCQVILEFVDFLALFFYAKGNEQLKRSMQARFRFKFFPFNVYFFVHGLVLLCLSCEIMYQLV